MRQTPHLIKLLSCAQDATQEALYVCSDTLSDAATDLGRALRRPGLIASADALEPLAVGTIGLVLLAHRESRSTQEHFAKALRSMQPAVLNTLRWMATSLKLEAMRVPQHPAMLIHVA